MGRQQHNVGASNRPASYPRHQHFGLKIGTVSSFYCGHPWDSKLVSATAKVMVEVSFQTKSVTNFCREFATAHITGAPVLARFVQCKS